MVGHCRDHVQNVWSPQAHVFACVAHEDCLLLVDFIPFLVVVAVFCTVADSPFGWAIQGP